MTKSQLISLIEAERQSVKQLRENLFECHKLAGGLEESVDSLSSKFEQLEEQLLSFSSGTQAAIAGENCTSIIVVV